MKRDLKWILDKYEVYIVDRVFGIAPVIGAMAAISFTLAKVFGYFPNTSVAETLLFDLLCLFYFVVARSVQKYVHFVDAIDAVRMRKAIPVLMICVLVQWNAISYLFPFREFWGFAPLFVILLAFYLNSRIVLYEIIGISVSIVISWLIQGEELLPMRDEFFVSNLVLRCIALVITFVCIYLVTFYSEQFKLVQRNQVRTLDEQNTRLENFNSELIAFTAEMVENRDVTSGAHINRMRDLTYRLANRVAEQYPEYGLNEDTIRVIANASVLHDVGKIKIPDSILQKPGRLTPEEFEVMKKHAEIGASIIDHMPHGTDKEFDRCCRDICLYHHERYDGRGYPAGLSGEEIPLSAQIVSIVDCYDALTSERPYKKAFSSGKAIQMINNGECGVFSEKLLKCVEVLSGH